MSPDASPTAEVPGYPQRRVLDLTTPVAAPLPAVTDEDRDQTERELVADLRSERRLVLWELLALLAVVVVVVVRTLWLL
jgi:hypothetical protein